LSPSLVSIVVPCFNAAPWICAALESALQQTWPATEIIVVDDGSTDGSLAIARSFEARGVRVFSQPNAGASSARNRGLREARGDFIQYLDADDLISPGKVAAQMGLLGTCPPGRLSSCRWGRFSNEPASARFVDDVVFRDFSPVEFLVLAGMTGAMIHPSAWLVPRSVTDRVGPWDESLSLNDDGEYFSRVALASTGITFCPDIGAKSYYRSGIPGSLSGRKGTAAARSLFRSLELVTTRLLEAEDTERTRRASASYWRRFVFDTYPASPALCERAASEVNRLGEPLGAPVLSGKMGILARFIGWKAAYRMRSWVGS